MASRQEEKQRRREERLARERTAARQAATRRRLQMVGGVAAALAVIAGVVVVVATSGGGNGGGQGPEASPRSNAKIPTRQISDFDAAIKAAGCFYKSYPSEGREHLASDSAVNNNYKTNPPTSGAHRPTPAEDGVYAPGNEPAKENAVHALEHGRIEIEYKPGTSAGRIAQLETLFNEPLKGVAGYHQLLFENNTNMPYQVAAVAWTQLLGCKTVTNKTFDALRAFRERFVDKGPELIP